MSLDYIGVMDQDLVLKICLFKTKPDPGLKLRRTDSRCFNRIRKHLINVKITFLNCTTMVCLPGSLTSHWYTRTVFRAHPPPHSTVPGLVYIIHTTVPGLVYIIHSAVPGLILGDPEVSANLYCNSRTSVL